MTPGVTVDDAGGPAGVPATVTGPAVAASFDSTGRVFSAAVFSGGVFSAATLSGDCGFFAGLEVLAGRLAGGLAATFGGGRRRSLADVVSAAGAELRGVGSDASSDADSAAARRPDTVCLGAGVGAGSDFRPDPQADTASTPMTKSP